MKTATDRIRGKANMGKSVEQSHLHLESQCSLPPHNCYWEKEQKKSPTYLKNNINIPWINSMISRKVHQRLASDSLLLEESHNILDEQNL